MRQRLGFQILQNRKCPGGIQGIFLFLSTLSRARHATFAFSRLSRPRLFSLELGVMAS